MNQAQQPEALRLAERLESAGRVKDAGRPPIQDTERKAAAELRRLHAENEEMRAQRKPMTDEQAKRIGQEAFRAVLDDLENDLHVAVVRRTERAHGIGEAA